jgi:hypothetical protein
VRLLQNLSQGNFALAAVGAFFSFKKLPVFQIMQLMLGIPFEISHILQQNGEDMSHIIKKNKEFPRGSNSNKIHL